MRKRILVIEDSEKKYRDIQATLTAAWDEGIEVTRAPTVRAAEQQIADRLWTAIVLDVSMDLTSSSSGARQGGHATTGGLSIARKMHLTGRAAPTVIVTAFSSFQGKLVERGKFVMIGLEEVQARAMETLKENYLGCIRYNEPGWEELMVEALRGVVER